MIADILNIKRLAEKLATGQIQDESAWVFLAIGDVLFVIFSFISAYVLGFSYLEFKAASLEAVITVVVIVFGIRACYRAYSGAKFMRDFIVLSVPALIYATLLSWVAHWSVIFAVGKYGETTSFSTEAEVAASMSLAGKALEIGAVAATVIGSICFFYFVWAGLKQIKWESKGPP